MPSRRCSGEIHQEQVRRTTRTPGRRRLCSPSWSSDDDALAGIRDLGRGDEARPGPAPTTITSASSAIVFLPRGPFP